MPRPPKDPNELLNKHGADALRLYLINSPVVRAEPLRFKEEGVFSVVKDVFLPWYNAYRFFVQNALRWEADNGARFQPAALEAGRVTNVLDRWIRASSRSLTNYVRQVRVLLLAGQGRAGLSLLVLGARMLSPRSEAAPLPCSCCCRRWACTGSTRLCRA